MYGIISNRRLNAMIAMIPIRGKSTKKPLKIIWLNFYLIFCVFLTVNQYRTFYPVLSG